MPKVTIALLAGAAVFIAGLADGGYRFYVHIEYDPTFCGSCHIMEKAWQTWQVGSHNRVNCHTCPSAKPWRSCPDRVALGSTGISGHPPTPNLPARCAKIAT
jgi:nitrate/TMAO reductase-like tetraheme cytochrome c subunit